MSNCLQSIVLFFTKYLQLFLPRERIIYAKDDSEIRGFEMGKSMLVLACVVAFSASAAAKRQDSEATKVIQRYLKMPMPRKPPGSGPERKARLKVLGE